MINDLLPEVGPPDMRAIRRTAAARVTAAVRRGHVRAVLHWGRVLARASRTLRFAARLKAGRVRIWLIDTRAGRAHPSSSHSLFSAKPEKQAARAVPTFSARPGRRRAFDEGRRRR